VGGRASELCAGSRQLRDGPHRFGIHGGIIAPIECASEGEKGAILRFRRMRQRLPMGRDTEERGILAGVASDGPRAMNVKGNVP
jgi:hypothetical protein